MKLKNTKLNENPFYGSHNLFALYQNGIKSTITPYLGKAWLEANTKEKKELFHVINFGIGDISQRQHNIFKDSKIDDGGNSASPQWIEYLTWLINNQSDQFIKFIPLIVEYVGLRELVTQQIKTQKGTKKIVTQWGLLELIHAKPIVFNALVDHVVKLAQGTTFQKHQVSKFLHIPRYSKRIQKNKKGEVVGKRDLQDTTIQKMHLYDNLIKSVSTELSWEINKKENYTHYTGFKNFKNEWGADLESLLFSTKEIETWDQEKFTNWLNILPSGARFKVQRRLFDGDKKEKGKWKNLAIWFTKWEKSKEVLQEEKRVLEVKATTEKLSYEDKEKLEILKKTAKVTTGSKTLFDYIEDFIKGKSDDITVQSILDKINFKVPVLSICDMSGSMSGKPQKVAALITTLTLLKNPNSFDNIFFGFGSEAQCFVDGMSINVRRNRFLSVESAKIKCLVDRTETFQENFNRINEITSINMGGTNFSGIPEQLKKWVDSTLDLSIQAQRKEQVLEYQVILLASDGDMNSSSSVGISMQDFMMKMRQWFGWEGIVIVWDIPINNQTINKSHYFDNIENVIHLTTFNISTINQIFTKIDDFDIVDIYSPLKSLYLSNRYDLVKQSVI